VLPRLGRCVSPALDVHPTPDLLVDEACHGCLELLGDSLGELADAEETGDEI